jgi:hypothetical protein
MVDVHSVIPLGLRGGRHPSNGWGRESVVDDRDLRQHEVTRNRAEPSSTDLSGVVALHYVRDGDTNVMVADIFASPSTCAGVATSFCTTRRRLLSSIATNVGANLLFARRARRPRQVSDGVGRRGRGVRRLVGLIVLNASAGPARRAPGQLVEHLVRPDGSSVPRLPRRP